MSFVSDDAAFNEYMNKLNTFVNTVYNENKSIKSKYNNLNEEYSKLKKEVEQLKMENRSLTNLSENLKRENERIIDEKNNYRNEDILRNNYISKYIEGHNNSIIKDTVQENESLKRQCSVLFNENKVLNENIARVTELKNNLIEAIFDNNKLNKMRRYLYSYYPQSEQWINENNHSNNRRFIFDY